MGFPTKLRQLWNKQAWERKNLPPVTLPEGADKTDNWKDTK